MFPELNSVISILFIAQNVPFEIPSVLNPIQTLIFVNTLICKYYAWVTPTHVLWTDGSKDSEIVVK